MNRNTLTHQTTGKENRKMRNLLLIGLIGAIAGTAWAQSIEFSNQPDKASDGAGGLTGPSPQQVLFTAPPDLPGPPGPSNSTNFGGTIDVDALGAEHDLRKPDGLPPAPPSVITGNLLISFAGDPSADAVYFEDPYGAVGVNWTQTDFCNPPTTLDDVDSLNRWGSTHFSEVGDPNGTSIWFTRDNGATRQGYATHALIVAAVQSLGYTGPESAVDLDALMVADCSAWGLWDALDVIMFSIRDTRPAGGSFDGGELVVLQADGSPWTAYFLVHGGHTWDTAFDVAGTFGVGTEEIDACEQDYCVGQGRGDCNGDGSVNTLDIDPFVGCLSEPNSVAPLYWQCVCDINCDGSVNSLDIDAFVGCLTGYCPPCP